MPIQSRVGKLNEFLKIHINSIIHLFDSRCWLGKPAFIHNKFPPSQKIVLLFISNSYAQMRLEINSPY